MAKAKRLNYALISTVTGTQCGYVRINAGNYDKAKRYMRYDKLARKHVECSTKEIKKGGTKAHAR